MHLPNTALPCYQEYYVQKINCNIILVTKNSERLSDIEIDKYNSQYKNLKVIRDNSFHDRYFILDRKTIYHSGASINNAGNKTFSINKLEDEFVINTILNNVLNIISKYFPIIKKLVNKF